VTAGRRWPVRLGLALATLVYLAYSSFGIAAPFWWGHYGYHGATYLLRARMSLRHHTFWPATWTGFDTPPANSIYFHHPIGYSHLFTLLVPIFGEHEWLAHGVGVAGGLFALWALYALVQRAWSREAGLCAVVVFVSLPFITSFSVLNDAMLPMFACVCWSLAAYLELLEKPSRRALVHAGLAYTFGGLLMWEPYLVALFVSVHALLYRLTPRGRSLRLGKHGALALHTLVIVGVCAAMMSLHLWLTYRSGAWRETLEAYRVRTAPRPHDWLVQRHELWMKILYGWPPVILGAAWLAWFVVRCLARRARRRDLAVMTFFYVNTIYIVLFPDSSATHLYRVFFYGGFFTLAITDLVVELGRRSTAIGAAVLLAYLAFEAPHAYANLLESREMMGTQGEPAYSPQREKMQFAAEITRTTQPSDRVIVDYRQLGSRKEFWYYLDRSIDEIASLSELPRTLPTQAKSLLLLDQRQLSSNDRPIYDELLRKHPVTFYGSFAAIDLRSQSPGARSFAFVPQPMTGSYRWLVSHVYPPLALQRIGYLPGLCDALKVGAPIAVDEALPEAPAPIDLARQACWHNLLLARGERGPAVEQAEKNVSAGLDRMDATIGRARVVGVTMLSKWLRLAILTSGPEAAELRYRATAADGSSKILPRGDGMPSPRDWQAGFLYFDELNLDDEADWRSVEAELVAPGEVVLSHVRLPIN
jgi:hypothetical protein